MSGQQAVPAPPRVPTTTVDVDVSPLAGLADDEVEALERLAVALGVHAGGQRPDVAEVLRLLDSDAVADLFVTEVVANRLVAPTAFSRFLALLRAEARARTASLELLSARLAEWRGQAIMGERFLDAGLLLAPRSVPILVDAAWCAADRGDAAAAADLLLRAGAPRGDPEVAALLELAARQPEPPEVPRNEPCPCGSGRRAKRCCRRGTGLPLEDRVSWLHAKAAAFARRPPQHASLLDAAAAVAGIEASPHAVEQLAAVAAGPLAANLVLFESGAMTDFVADRGALLPSDERNLAKRWASCRHGLLVADDEGRLREVAAPGRATTDPVPGAIAGTTYVGVLVPAPGGRFTVLDGWQPADPAALPRGRELDARAVAGAIRAAAG